MGSHHHLPVGSDVVDQGPPDGGQFCVTIVRWPCEPHPPSLSVRRVAGGLRAA